MGIVRDAYDTAIAEMSIGAFETEVIRRCGPWRSIDAVEYATLEWWPGSIDVALLGPLGYSR